MLVVDFDPSTVTAAEETELTAVSLSHVATELADSRAVLIMCGAGMSTSSGLPDFRGMHGLHRQARRADNSASPQPSTSSSSPAPRTQPFTSQTGKALFNVSVYREPATRQRHWECLAELRSTVDAVAPSDTHAFLRVLKESGKLQRVYTQNIDGLEGRRDDEGNRGLEFVDLPGVAPSSKRRKRNWQGEVVQLHGSLMSVRCTECDWVGRWRRRHTEAFARGETRDCPGCLDRAEERRRLAKRSLPVRSFVRPAIVLYDEDPPAAEAIGEISALDLSIGPDLLLVFGTSLKIPGFKMLVRDFSRTVRENNGLCVLVNADAVASEWDDVFDYHFIARCDDFSNRILGDWRHSSTLAFRIARTAKKRCTRPNRTTTPDLRKLPLLEPASNLSYKRPRAPPSLASTVDPPDEPESADDDASESYAKLLQPPAPEKLDPGAMLLDEKAMWREATGVLKAQRRERRLRMAADRIAGGRAALWAA